MICRHMYTKYEKIQHVAQNISTVYSNKNKNGGGAQVPLWPVSLSDKTRVCLAIPEIKSESWDTVSWVRISDLHVIVLVIVFA